MAQINSKMEISNGPKLTSDTKYTDEQIWAEVQFINGRLPDEVARILKEVGYKIVKVK